jgi:long-chain fatty acid transport protein
VLADEASDFAATAPKAHALMRRLLASLAFTVLALPPGFASAAGLSVARFGGEHGNPMATNATAIFYNPAGIADSSGGHVFGDANLAFRRATYTHESAPTDAPVPPGAEGANTGRATMFNVLVEPFVGATYKFGHVAVGAAYFVPFGGQNTWDKNDAFQGNGRFPGAVDGVQRWYTIQGALRSSFLSVAGAYDFGNLSAGISVNLIDTIVNTVQARNATGDNDVRNEGRAWLDAQSWDVSVGAGLAYRPIHNLRLGLSYQSRPNFGGDIRATGDLHLFTGSRTDSRIAFTTNLPDIVRGGAAYRPNDRIELRLFGDYTRWSALEHQCVMAEASSCNINADGSAATGSEVDLNFVRNWHDTFAVRAGGSYFLTPKVELYAGVGYTSNAVPNSTLEPALLDFNAMSAAVGGVFSLFDRVQLGTTYTQVFYISRDTTGQSIHAAELGASRSPDSGGKYTLALGLLNVNVDVAF